MFLAVLKYLKEERGKLFTLKMILGVPQSPGTPRSSRKKDRLNSIHGKIIRKPPAGASTQRGEGRQSEGMRGGTINRSAKSGECSARFLLC